METVHPTTKKVMLHNSQTEEEEQTKSTIQGIKAVHHRDINSNNISNLIGITISELSNRGGCCRIMNEVINLFSLLQRITLKIL